jgi:hypothetical protein
VPVCFNCFQKSGCPPRTILQSIISKFCRCGNFVFSIAMLSSAANIVSPIMYKLFILSSNRCLINVKANYINLFIAGIFPDILLLKKLLLEAILMSDLDIYKSKLSTSTICEHISLQLLTNKVSPTKAKKP